MANPTGINQYTKGGAKTVRDPFTKRSVKIKSIKQQAGGRALRNGVPFSPGVSKHWLAKFGKK